jgi:hypothetical protein
VVNKLLCLKAQALAQLVLDVAESARVEKSDE